LSVSEVGRWKGILQLLGKWHRQYCSVLLPPSWCGSGGHWCCGCVRVQTFGLGRGSVFPAFASGIRLHCYQYRVSLCLFLSIQTHTFIFLRRLCQP